MERVYKGKRIVIVMDENEKQSIKDIVNKATSPTNKEICALLDKMFAILIENYEG